MKDLKVFDVSLGRDFCSFFRKSHLYLRIRTNMSKIAHRVLKICSSCLPRAGNAVVVIAPPLLNKTNMASPVTRWLIAILRLILIVFEFVTDINVVIDLHNRCVVNGYKRSSFL